jgi:hypothetical protein
MSSNGCSAYLLQNRLIIYVLGRFCIFNTTFLSFGSADAAGSCKVLLQQRFFLKLQFYDCPFSFTRTNPAILIMVAIGRSELLS